MAEQKETGRIGLYINGIIIAKNHYPASKDKQERFALDLGVTGCKELFTVQVSALQFTQAQELAPFACWPTMRSFNGRIYFDAREKQQ